MIKVNILSVYLISFVQKLTKMKRFNILFLFLYSSMIWAQSNTSSTKDSLSIGADLMSRYIFRGMDIGASPSIQPNLTYTTGKFNIGLWGAYTLNKFTTQEADIFITYNVNEQFSLTLTDYFFPSETGSYNYFDYKKDTTGHLLEGNLTYTGQDKFPIQCLIAVNFYGSDAIRLNHAGLKKGIQYSTYAEISYPFKYFDAFIGANLTKPHTDLGETGFYGNDIGIINLGLTTHKEVKLSSTYSLPMSLSFITNPQSGKVFLVFGLSL